jgi:hypothetical protein
MNRPNEGLVQADPVMERVNIHQARTHLSQLLQVLEQGLEVVIARLVVPIARPDSGGGG